MEGSDSESEVEVIDLVSNDERGSTANLDSPVTQTVSAPLLHVPPMQDQTSNNVLTNAMIIVPVKTETVEIRVKTENAPLVFGTDSANIEATYNKNVGFLTPFIQNSLSPEIAPKVEESSQPGPSCLSPQPWEYVVVARDEVHAPIEDLLNCLAVEELQSLVKSLKIKCSSKKVS